MLLVTGLLITYGFNLPGTRNQRPVTSKFIILHTFNKYENKFKTKINKL